MMFNRKRWIAILGGVLTLFVVSQIFGSGLYRKQFSQVLLNQSMHMDIDVAREENAKAESYTEYGVVFDESEKIVTTIHVSLETLKFDESNSSINSIISKYKWIYYEF